MADAIPEFWGVWADGLDAPLLVGSEVEAVEQAYALARGKIGATVHVLKCVTKGAFATH